MQPRQAFPIGFRAVREEEFTKETFEIELVVVSDVPEHGLIVACASRLVERIDDLLEIVGDDLVDGALLKRKIDHALGILIIIGAELLADEIVHIHQEFGRGAGTAEHRTDHEHHVHETAAERFEVGRCGRIAANRRRSADEPRIHRNRGAVVGERCFVVFINEVVREHFDIFVAELLAVHLFNAVGQKAAIQSDETCLGQFANQSCNIFMLDVGICVIL